jgi:hypothetical protein
LAQVEHCRQLNFEDVTRFYAGKSETRRRPFPGMLDPGEFTLTNTAQGLGDCVVLTDHARSASAQGLPHSIWSPAPAFAELLPWVPWALAHQMPRWVSLASAVQSWGLGPGHMIQRAQRLFGLPVDPVPHGALSVNVARRPGRVSLHFEAGSHAAWQRGVYHPRARQLYAENRVVIREFIEAHPELTFIEFGREPVIRHERVENACGRPLRETIPLLAECEFHLGIVSGPMHVAAALGVKLIVVLNFPHPSQLMLPQLVDTGVVEGEWLYPQAVHLHQDHDSPHWPRFNRMNLERAFAGEVYPYWKREVICA